MYKWNERKQKKNWWKQKQQMGKNRVMEGERERENESSLGGKEKIFQRHMMKGVVRMIFGGFMLRSIMDPKKKHKG